MRKRFGIIFMILGCILLAGAVGLFAHNRTEDKEAGNISNEILQQVKYAQSEAEPVSVAPEAETVETAEETEDDEDNFAMDVVAVDEYDYIGTLYIPDIDLELPVMSDWSYPQLKIAPCRYSGSVASEDLVIAAHNYDHHFGRLKNLNPGSIITFTDTNDVRTAYSVESVETLDPYAVDEMTSGEYALTLFTCTYGGTNRVAVRCNLFGQ